MTVKCKIGCVERVKTLKIIKEFMGCNYPEAKNCLDFGFSFVYELCENKEAELRQNLADIGSELIVESRTESEDERRCREEQEQYEEEERRYKEALDWAETLGDKEKAYIKLMQQGCCPCAGAAT